MENSEWYAILRHLNFILYFIISQTVFSVCETFVLIRIAFSYK